MLTQHSDNAEPSFDGLNMTEAAAETVRELLDAILGDVCAATEWDVASRAISLSLTFKEPEHCHGVPDHAEQASLVTVGGVEEETQIEIDVHSVVGSLPLSRVVVAFTLKSSSKIHVVQLKCVEQKASGYCGHYALFFALCSLELSQAKTVRDAEGYLNEMSSNAAFWRRYWFSVGELVKHVDAFNGQLWWPWTREHIHTGDMERSFLTHLLSRDHHLQDLDQDNRIMILHYAYGLIQTSHEDICHIQKQLTKFRNSSTSTHLVFILGVTNHWVTLLAYKSCVDRSHDQSHDTPCDQVETSHMSCDYPPKSCDKERMGLLYLDSNNAPVLMASEDYLHELLREREEKRKKRKGKGYTEWQRGNYLQAYRDQRDVVKLIADCVCGEKDLLVEKMRLSWSNVLSSYEHYVIELLVEDSDHDVYLMVLVQWLEQHCHPKTLQNHHAWMLRQHGVDKLGLEGHTRLERWVEHCMKWLGGGRLKVTGIQIVDRFTTLVQEIAELCCD